LKINEGGFAPAGINGQRVEKLETGGAPVANLLTNRGGVNKTQWEIGASEGIRIMRTIFHNFLICCGLQRYKTQVRLPFRIERHAWASMLVQLGAKREVAILNVNGVGAGL